MLKPILKQSEKAGLIQEVIGLTDAISVLDVGFFLFYWSLNLKKKPLKFLVSFKISKWYDGSWSNSEIWRKNNIAG